MNEFLHRAGFLGTNANLAADFTLVMMLLIAGLFTWGAVLAHQKRYETHRWVQTSAALLNLGMVAWMMLLPYRDFVVRDLGGPRPEYFYLLTRLHALVGLAAVTFGVFVTLRGNRLVPKALRFKKYKPYMRTAYSLYILTTLLGVLVYLAWFVWIPNAPLY